MKNMMLVAALVAVVGFGCKKKKPEEGTGPGPTPAGSDMGSAPAGSGSAAAGSAGSAAAAKPMSGEDLAKRTDQCWGYYNDAKWDDFKGCYAADAVDEAPGSAMPAAKGADAIAASVKVFKDAIPDDKGEQVFELVSGHTVIAVSNTVGTNSGPFKTPMGEMPPSKNKVGGLFAQVIDFDDAGKVKHEWDFSDMGALMGQMKPDPKHPVRAPMDKAPMAKEVVVSKDDAGEKANIEVAKKLAEAFSKHDSKAIGDVLADDLKWSDQARPKDADKKELVANSAMEWKAFSDLKITPDKLWAAGDYVAATATMEGTNDGDMPAMGIKKTGKKVAVPHLVVFKIQGGKIKNAWIFADSMAMAAQLGMLPPAGAAPAGDKKDEPKKDDKKAPAPAKKG